jgi:excisionase family DNA binding protein
VNDEYIGATEAAKRLGVHINTVRNWAKDGRLQPVQLPGSKRSQYRVSDIDRMVADRGQPVSTVGSGLRTAALDFVDAENLDSWEGRRAQERLPELLRRLLARTPGITNASVRAGEGISVTGWDGVATSDGRAAFLPTGPIRFEAGTSSDYMKKAQSDYDNRVAAASGKPSAEHFVFVTNRRWKTKTAWEAEREAEGMFQSVRVLDADDLIGWLEATPFVHLWISEVLGRRPTEVQTLDQWWAEFGANHEPALTEDLFLAGRSAEREELFAFL